MSTFPSAPFPEYGSCNSNCQSHSFPYHQQPQSYNHAYSHQVSHSQQECGAGGGGGGGNHFIYPSGNMNMASAPAANAFPPYPPPYSPYPGHACQPGQLPHMSTGGYPPQMPYPSQQPAGWYQGPPMGQPQVVHVVTSEPARSVSTLSSAVSLPIVCQC